MRTKIYLNADYVPDSALLTILRSSVYYLHFTDGETKIQRSLVSEPKATICNLTKIICLQSYY